MCFPRWQKSMTPTNFSYPIRIQYPQYVWLQRKFAEGKLEWCGFWVMNSWMTCSAILTWLTHALDWWWHTPCLCVTVQWYTYANTYNSAISSPIVTTKNVESIFVADDSVLAASDNITITLSCSKSDNANYLLHLSVISLNVNNGLLNTEVEVKTMSLIKCYFENF